MNKSEAFIEFVRAQLKLNAYLTLKMGLRIKSEDVGVNNRKSHLHSAYMFNKTLNLKEIYKSASEFIETNSRFGSSDITLKKSN